ncbi:MAG: hypothetical protein ACI915_004643 [Gammaproteobacteria bacterium]|jgi:hypothetical protein
MMLDVNDAAKQQFTPVGSELLTMRRQARGVELQYGRF